MGNFRYPITLFLASFVVLVIGILFRIMHWPGGRLITGGMLMVQAVAIVWLILLLVKSNRKS
jgi:hypothetical protein